MISIRPNISKTPLLFWLKRAESVEHQKQELPNRVPHISTQIELMIMNRKIAQAVKEKLTIYLN